MSSAAPASSGLYVLDTSILILSLRGDVQIRARLAAAMQLYIPSTALGELFSAPTAPPLAWMPQ